MTDTIVSIAIHSEELFGNYSQSEVSFVENLANIHNKSYVSINFGEDVIRDMIMSSIFGKSVSAKSAITAYRLMIKRVSLIAQQLEDFVTLPHEIQNSLLKHNADMIVSLRGAEFFHVSKQGQDQLLCSLGIDDLKTASSIVEQVKATHNTNDRPVTNFIKCLKKGQLDQGSNQLNNLIAELERKQSGIIHVYIAGL